MLWVLVSAVVVVEEPLAEAMRLLFVSMEDCRSLMIEQGRMVKTTVSV